MQDDLEGLFTEGRFALKPKLIIGAIVLLAQQDNWKR